MALTKCPSCGREVSTEAVSCPNCGHQFKYAGGINLKDPVHIVGFQRFHQDMWHDPRSNLALLPAEQR